MPQWAPSRSFISPGERLRSSWGFLESFLEVEGEGEEEGEAEEEGEEEEEGDGEAGL